MEEAPNHFAYDSDNHCYVCQQPQTAAETTDLISTAWMAELQCIRYRGNDADVLRRFAELDLRDLCDIDPPRSIKPIIRNHVEFAVVDSLQITTPQQLASEFVDHLRSQNNEWRQFKTTSVQTAGDSASLEFSWYDDHFHPLVFTATAGGSNKWHIHHPLTNDLGDHGVGNVVSFWLSQHPDRFKNMRWYTDEDWVGPKIGQSTRI
jgi:hypothetical protein